jgi:hypothetical protein
MDSANSVFYGKQSNAAIIASGTIVPLDRTPIDIGIPIAEGNQLTLQLSFRRDDEEKKSRWNVTPVTGNPLKIGMEMVNLDSPLGGGPSTPVRLWTSGTSGIYLALRVITQGEAPPVIHFSFYRREEAPTQ